MSSLDDVAADAAAVAAAAFASTLPASASASALASASASASTPTTSTSEPAPDPSDSKPDPDLGEEPQPETAAEAPVVSPTSPGPLSEPQTQTQTQPQPLSQSQSHSQPLSEPEPEPEPEPPASLSVHPEPETEAGPESVSGPEPLSDTSAAVAALQDSLLHPQKYGYPQYDGLPTTPVSAVAHHGLQALQAASASPPSITSPTSDHLAQQYAQSASLQMGEPRYAQVSNVVNGNHGSPSDLHVHPHPHAHIHAHAGAPTVAQPMSSMSPNGTPQKVTRLRRACDMCSQRKVKCDESGPPCKPCADLNVECTFQRQMKRRGPPNKHAEAARAAKRNRVDGPDGVPNLLPLSPQQDDRPGIDAEAIAPWPVLELLVDDFFTYIHPLIPFPHQPTFRQAFAERADRTSGRFLALLASMIGVLVASFPRSARSHLKAQHSTNLFPTSITMIDRCRDVALQARGALFMASEEMTVEDAATSYFLGLSAAYTLRWKPCKRFMAETMTFVREVSVHRQRDSVSGADITSTFGVPTSKPIDHIKDQMTKRIFWVIVAGVRSMTQLGVSINDLPLPPPTSQEQYPDQPVEVDDEYIYTDQILSQPEGIPSLITGFNRNICVYTTMNELVGVDMCYGMKFFDWSAQKNILSNGLSSAKQATEDLPLHLQVKVEPGQAEPPPTFDYGGLQYHPPAFPAAQPSDDVRHAFTEDPMRRRQLQFEIQKANIYASSLATRSYFVERYLNLRDAERQRRKAEGAAAEEAGEDESSANKDERDAMVARERELIVQNLLAVLTSISQRNMEPNGGSITHKIRQVASTLLNDAPERKGPVAVKAEEYLNKFLDILMRLEKTGGTAPGPMTAQHEEEELQCWASLRDYQLEFAANGGFMGEG